MKLGFKAPRKKISPAWTAELALKALRVRCNRNSVYRQALVAICCLGPWSICLATAFHEIRLTTNGADEVGIDMKGDRFGRLHIVYSRDGNLFYQCRHFEGACLVPEESVCPGLNPSIAVDPEGLPRVAAVSSGQWVFASRDTGSWTSRVVSSANVVSLDVAESGQAYVAYSTVNSGNGHSDVILACVTTGSVTVLGTIFGSYDASYACGSHAAGEHHNFARPVLRCSSGVVHVVAEHLRNRDSYYIPGQAYCSAAHDERVAYCRYDCNLSVTQYAYSEWSGYGDVEVRPNRLCITPDGTVHLAYSSGPGGFYTETLFPWSYEYLSFYPGPSIDSTRNGLLGILCDDGGALYLKVRSGGVFGTAAPIKPQGFGQEEAFSMEYAAVVLIQDAGAGAKEVYLLAALDTDEDGINDAWERQYFGGLTNAFAGADNDGDSVLNGEEYVCGTDPMNSNSVFGLRVDRNAAEEPVLSWTGALSRLYTLQVSANDNASWSDVPGYVDRAGHAAILQVTNPAAGFGPNRYRAEVRLGP